MSLGQPSWSQRRVSGSKPNRAFRCLPSSGTSWCEHLALGGTGPGALQVLRAQDRSSRVRVGGYLPSSVLLFGEVRLNGTPGELEGCLLKWKGWPGRTLEPGCSRWQGRDGGEVGEGMGAGYLE